MHLYDWNSYTIVYGLVKCRPVAGCNRLDICASVEQNLRQRHARGDYLRTAASTHFGDFELSIDYCVVKWSPTVPTFRLDICTLVEQDLPRLAGLSKNSCVGAP